MTQGSESVRFGKRTTDTVLHRFERWARDTPGARALIAGPEGLTYGELDARADRLAHRLLASGPLPPGALVAVGTARQTELIVALLAVLKAGGSYTVIDVESARSGRRQLAAAQPLVLLTDAAQHAALDNGGGPRVIRLDADAAAIGGPRTEQPADRPAGVSADISVDVSADAPADPPADRLPGAVAPPPGRTAAVLFTGAAEPRAVPVSQGTLLAAHEGWAEVARPTAQDRHLFTGGPDITAFAAGWTRALCSGGALVLSPRSAWKPEDIRAAVEADRVTVLHTDPAGAARLLIEDAEQGSLTPAAHLGADPACRSLRLLAVTGGRLYLDEQATLQVRLRPGARVLNVYGSAECAGIGTWFELPQLPHPLDDPERISLLGTAFPGFRAEVHGGEIRLVPPDGADAIPTGDLGLLREDGLLEYGGRLRDRITLPGGRWLDPYPVESAIRSHDGIGAVILKGVDGPRGPRRLVAYVAPPPGGRTGAVRVPLPDIEELRDHLAGKVLREESPRTVIRLRTLPRTAAGQEDRDALPLPILPAAAKAAGSKSGKYGAAAGTSEASAGCAAGCGGVGLGFVAMILTNFLWPGSTDLTGVPQPWAFLFSLLYLFECAAFGVGVVFLFGGRARMLRQRRSPSLTVAAHLAVSYLLLSWWPQDNLYRLAAKQDWPRQAALVYAFNIPLMIAGVVVAAYVVSKPADPFDFHDPVDDWPDR
ncbi:AMP-binding protein [Streptomyces xanthophaeus]|uniref:AMP-binding protein n=1 Tax=Streptomyces xanthophaeus TaxID=67385 RepID=UPI002648704E|nr:AMP-binding protein [Streptomyces xanthophaeus]WKD30772.1 AMP-binding protein [Streptomyces xanthophaeus]